MSRGDLAWTVLGRPAKPLSLAAMLGMLGLVLINSTGRGVFDGSWLANIMVVLSGITAMLCLAGWWYRSQPLAEAALLAAVGVWVTRMSFALVTNPGNINGWWFSGCWAVAFGGAFMLERLDDRDR